MAQLNIASFFKNEARALRDAREKCIEIHGSDIRAAGNEVEIAVRKWLDRMLPDTVSVGHGHLIDSNSQISPQLDCILRDRSHLPTLFTSADGTEYTPIDSVFAYGEIKSAYYRNSNYIQCFAATKKKMRKELVHELIENTAKDGINGDALLHHLLLGSSEPYLNQIFTFMLFVDSGDASNDDLAEIYSTTDDRYLPDIAVFLNSCMVIKAIVNENRFQMYKYSDTAPSEAGWIIVPVPKIDGTDSTSEGKNLGILYFSLLNHIKGSSLEGPNLSAYMYDLLIRSKSSLIPIAPQQGAPSGASGAGDL